MSPLRVVQVTLSMGQGGIENLIVSLAREVRPEKIRFSVYCLDYGGELLGAVQQHGLGVRVFDRRPGIDWRLVANLARALRDDSIQVVHTHNQAAHFYGCLAARAAGVPVVIATEHSRHNLERRWRRRFEKWLLSHLTSYLVTVSEELRQQAIQQDKVAANKLTTIVNGVDVAKFSEVSEGEIQQFRRQLRIAPDIRLVSIVARLNPVKNHLLLLEACTYLMSDHPDVRILIVGEGDERKRLESIATSLQITEYVFFLGVRGDIPVILKASAALVLCSVTEGLPLVLLEGMAARIPLVVTKGANRSRLIDDGVTGFECSESAYELAKCISRILRGNRDIARVTTTAFNLVSERYSISQTLNAYEQLYFRCLSRVRNRIAQA
jgi:glycosyltransferase involved in cell wall biosynthesis